MRRLVTTVVVWWAVATGLWCVFIGTITTSEVLAGVAAGAIAAGGAGHLRVIGWPTFRIRPRWVRWLPGLVAMTMRDTARLARLLIRAVPRRGRVQGRFETDRFGPTGSGADALGYRAVATLALTSTPGSYIVDTDERRGRATVHVLPDDPGGTTSRVAP